jgi:outer membrane receptor protein involved in Fe transport
MAQKTLKASAAFGVLAAFVPMGYAQDAPASRPAAGGEEIIVTAKGRAQRLYDVPLSVSAFDGGQLERENVTDLRDLANLAPSLTFTSATGRTNVGNLAIRGLGPNTIRQQQQSVGFFLDGVFIGGAASTLGFMEFERIEVLRGPQATEFGRQTYAGAINYVLKSAKTDKLTANVKGGFATNEGAIDPNTDVSASVRLLIAQDHLWLALWASQSTKGAMHVTPSTGAEIGEEETLAWGGQLKFEPAPSWDFTLTYLRSEEDDSAPLTVTLTPQEWAAYGVPTTRVRRAADPAGATIIWPRGALDFDIDPSLAGCESTPASPRVTAATARFIGKPFQCGTLRERDYFSWSASKTFGNGVTLVYRGGRLEEERFSNQDLYFRAAPDPFFGNPVISKAALIPQGSDNAVSENTSHEVRLTSSDEGRLLWKIGAFHFEESETGFRLGSSTATNPLGKSRGAEGLEEWAVFAGAKFKLTDRFAIELEDRYMSEDYTRAACSFCASTTPASSINRTKHNPRVTVSWTGDNALLYALYSQGMKAGRYNQSAPFDFIDPEENTNYEIGGNIRLFDNRFNVQAAAFKMDVENQQFSATSTTGGVATSITQNAGASEIEGFELSAVARASDQLTLRAAVGYADQVFLNATAPGDANLERIFNGGTFKGTTSIGVPKWSGNAGVDWRANLSADWDFIAGATVTYKGENFGDAANASIIPAITRINLRSGLEGAKWDLAFFVNDLMDNEKPAAATTGATNTCLFSAGNPANQRCLAVAIDRGREVGVTVARKF